MFTWESQREWKSEIAEGRENIEQLTQPWKYQMYVTCSSMCVSCVFVCVGVYDSIVAPTAVLLHFKQQHYQ